MAGRANLGHTALVVGGQCVLAALADVFLSYRSSTFGISCFQSVNEVGMVRASLGRIARRHIRPPLGEESRENVQSLNRLKCPTVSSPSKNRQVKFDIGVLPSPDPVGSPSRLFCVLKFIHNAEQTLIPLTHQGEVVGADPLGGTGCRVALQGLSKVVQIGKFFAAEGGNKTAEARPMLGQAFADQLGGCLADRNQADADLLGQFSIGESVPRSQITMEQLVENVLVGLLLEGRHAVVAVACAI